MADKEYVEREAIKKLRADVISGKVHFDNEYDMIDAVPAADVVAVVRCGKCKHSKPIDTKEPPYRYYKPECIMCYCEEAIGDEPMVYLPTHFCGFGEVIDNG